MSDADRLALGDWNALCFRCGRKFKASLMRKNWQGFYTCLRDWEPRQPQDFVRAIPDKMAPPWAQPDLPPDFAPMCTPADSQAIPGLGTPGCMIPGRNDHLTPANFPFCTITSVYSRAGFAGAGCWTVGVTQ
jgi:hypothetical protein